MRANKVSKPVECLGRKGGMDAKQKPSVVR